jgi:hypothetical protein
MVSACVRRGVIGALAAVALSAAAPSVAAPTAPPSAADGAALLSAKQWMVRAQSGDGGLPVAGFAARHRVNLWGALGLAAADVNARDQATSANSRTLFSLLHGFAADGELSDTADLALYLLAAHAVGFTAVRGEEDGVGGTGIHDIVADLLAAQLPGTSPDRGAFQAQPGSAGSGDPLATAYAVLALSSLDRIDQSYNNYAVTWLLTHQNGDGSWGASPGAPGDVETTATVLEALVWAPQVPGAASSLGASWLGQRQGADGGWSATGDGTTSDVPATAAVARWLNAQGVNPNNDNNSSGQSPMSFLRSAQDPATHIVGRAPGVPAAEPTQTTAAAMLAFGGTGLLFGPIAGGADSDELPNQRPPAGLPSGPLLPTETLAPKTSTPTAPVTAPAPTIQTPATPPTTSRTGVKRVNAHRHGTGTHGDGSGTTDAGSGSGAGGTVGTPGAPNRAGGGGGTATSAISAPAATPGAGVPVPTGRPGGTRATTGATAPREVSGTLLGRHSPTQGARGSSVAAPGASGAQSGGATTPWWAIALALAIAVGILGGIRLDRRNPQVAL